MQEIKAIFDKQAFMFKVSEKSNKSITINALLQEHYFSKKR